VGVRGKVAQTMYTHVNQCKNDKRRKEKTHQKRKKRERKRCKNGMVSLKYILMNNTVSPKVWK
jgi:CRISPR/Cas system-associated endonuclease Cas1